MPDDDQYNLIEILRIGIYTLRCCVFQLSFAFLITIILHNKKRFRKYKNTIRRSITPTN